MAGNNPLLCGLGGVSMTSMQRVLTLPARRCDFCSSDRRFRRTCGESCHQLTVVSLVCVLLTVTTARAEGPAWSRTTDGTVVIEPVPVPVRLRNADWPADWELEFQKRADYVIAQTARDGRYGGTFFENEKRAYGWAMLSILGGYEEPALQFLQAEDADAGRWHSHTLGIDYFAAFTLKHQIRKYFFFGAALDPDYRSRMRDAARIFTEQDPLRRPHHAFTGEGVWGPDGKNSWVDVRNTDNLKLMRDTSVYLLAEETDNEETRSKYKQQITDFVVALYHTGMGEWDSENYLGHSAAPLLNLYDFARDPDVKLLAKAALDRIALNLALKYWRGSFGGPTKRDYNHPYAFGGSAASLAWLWFGLAPRQPDEFESDEVHVITSSYRPPAAIVETARRQFSRPLTILSGKPGGSPWDHLDEPAPRYLETVHYGENFMFGSLLRGTQSPDVNGFKILTRSEEGADTIVAGPVSDPLKLGSPMYEDGLLAPNSAVAHHDNLAIYLTQESSQPYLLLVPADAEIQQNDGVTFVGCDRATLAIWPLNLEPPSRDDELTERVQFEQARNGETRPRWTSSQVLRAERRGKGVYGFAIEVDEGDRKTFLERSSQVHPETDELAVRGAAAITGVNGKRIRLQWGDTPHAIRCWFDGREQHWDSPERTAAYHTVGGNLVQQSWQGDGTLTVRTAERLFACTVDRNGQVAFREE